MSHLTRIVPLAQRLLGEILADGDLAVDLTAGNGHDTLFLYHAVAPTGGVIAFDIDPGALDNTATRLQQAGVAVYQTTQPPAPFRPAAVVLVAAGHENCGQFLPAAPKAMIANLGYLPGSQRLTPTRLETTLTALDQAAARLAVGGRLAVVAYPGHAGGDQEAVAVDAWFASHEQPEWEVLRISVSNCPLAPLLHVAEKQR